MYDLNSFFDGMSKPLLRNVHAKAFGHKGLLNNALIQSEALDFYKDRDRAIDLFVKMNPWQRRCLNLLYHSGSRGLTYNELRLTVPVSESRQLQDFLLSICKEFLVWRTSSAGTMVYYGFSDFAGCFEIPDEVDSVPKASSFQSFGNLIDWHICLVLSFAMRKELKVNTNNTIHRRSYQICLDCLAAAKQLSEKAAENELSLIFLFLTENGWLEQEDACLVPSEKALEFIRKNGFRLHQDVVSWWVKERFRGDRSHCVQLLKELESPRYALDASYRFWVMDPASRLLEKNKEMAWDYLPRPLRELWLLGLVKFSVVRGKVETVTLDQSGLDWIQNAIASIPEQNISCLPNFELIVSTGTNPRVLFSLACLASVENDETFLRFNLNRESYIQGLKSGLSETEIEHFKTWIKPPVNVADTLQEWNSSFYGARVHTVRLLKIEDLKILTELSRFPQFTECTEEYIPGYGFILKPEMEKRVFEILENYGFNPFVERRDVERTKMSSEEWRKDFAVAWPEAKAPDYELKNDADEGTIQTALNSTKYGSNYQQLAMFDLVKVLRYAKTVGTLVGAKVKDPAKRLAKEEEKIFFVHGLRLAKPPQTIEIQVYGQEEKTSLDLSFIKEIKVIGKKEL
ncbi:hypothetical protein BGX12_10633 [Fibrobacter sp. UWR4]|nr:hypothetical protein BGX12_10633 [Fibrobacter sp. UWR4]PZW70824.1 hypothetical protein C8E88_101016 [Fibrobacter sp. UWR1]